MSGRGKAGSASRPLMLSGLACCIAHALYGHAYVMGAGGMAEQAVKLSTQRAWFDAMKVNGLDKVAPNTGNGLRLAGQAWSEDVGIIPPVAPPLVVVPQSALTA